MATEFKHSVICPEMGEKTTATIQYKCSYGGGFYLNTNLELKGIGIRKIGDGSNHARGLKSYIVTDRALKILKSKYDTCYISLL